MRESLLHFAINEAKETKVIPELEMDSTPMIIEES